jgi:pimeloyl-ACP methyl ester carboxylesterase
LKAKRTAKSTKQLLASYFFSIVVLLVVPNMVLLDKGLSTAMNTKIVGSGKEVIVLAHGFGTDQSVWDKILPYLDKHFKVVVFDWSFSGAVEDHSLFNPLKYSSYDAFANDLIALLDELNLQSLVFVGHSMSGMIGCIASIKRPELFKQLILIGASPRSLFLLLIAFLFWEVFVYCLCSLFVVIFSLSFSFSFWNMIQAYPFNCKACSF